MTQPHPGPNGWQQQPGQPTPQWQPLGAHTPQSYPAPPPVQPPKRKKWPFVVGGIVLLIALPGFFVDGKSQSTPATPTTPTWSSAAPVAPAAQPAQAAPAASSGPQTSFGDGTWVVGEDIASGTYKSAGAKAGMFELCSVTTHSDTDADSHTVLDWKTANANEPIRLKVAGKVKSVKASGCEDFQKVG